jgi:hypothetical protein
MMNKLTLPPGLVNDLVCAMKSWPVKLPAHTHIDYEPNQEIVDFANQMLQPIEGKDMYRVNFQRRIQLELFAQNWLIMVKRLAK